MAVLKAGKVAGNAFTSQESRDIRKRLSLSTMH